jgi:glycosyltransferase involved in cell wall biosynthesis
MNGELIEEGVNGFIIPARSTETLYEKMKFVINNKNILNVIRFNNRFIAMNYHIDAVYTQLKDVLI